jgi:hypothetical protein
MDAATGSDSLRIDQGICGLATKLPYLCFGLKVALRGTKRASRTQ